jgi:hypothetical protein
MMTLQALFSKLFCSPALAALKAINPSHPKKAIEFTRKSQKSWASIEVSLGCSVV